MPDCKNGLEPPPLFDEKEDILQWKVRKKKFGSLFFWYFFA